MGLVEAALLFAAIFAVLISSLLYLHHARGKRVEAERLEKLLAEVRVEAERLKAELSKVERLREALEGRVLPALASTRLKEALKELEILEAEAPPSLRGEVEAYRSEVEAVGALREACRDAVKAWIMQAVRVNLPQTMRNWGEARHGYNRHLDELLAYTLAEAVEASPQSLLQWFRMQNPAMYQTLTTLVDHSESLEVFFRMAEKTLESLEYLKVFRRKLAEAREAVRLKAALELERRKIMDGIERLSEKLLKDWEGG
ncbi:MAG: hypothetical protein DRO52_03010 [Candidatus Hecatellales archaeon]|nr:MAG: hypothetical protein DRO52_03010 [Candidatus Hecatellales archaeon]